MGTRVLLIVIGFFSIFGCASAQEEKKKDSVYNTGISLINQKGVEAGIDYFEKNAIQTGSYSALFGVAWGFWTEGNLEEAEKICDFIIFKDPKEVLVAHCLYLKGHIAITRGQHDTGKDHFLNALPVYKKLKRHGDIYKTTLGIATSCILGKEYRDGENYLKTALLANDKAGKNLGQYYYLYSRLAFGEDRLDEALRYSRESYQQYKLIGDKKSMANALSDIGFYLFITGDFEEGLKKTNEANQIIQNLGLVKWSYYNSINYILAYRCSGLPYASFVEKVRFWINKTEDMDLEEMLEYVLNYDCM